MKHVYYSDIEDCFILMTWSMFINDYIHYIHLLMFSNYFFCVFHHLSDPILSCDVTVWTIQ